MATLQQGFPNVSSTLVNEQGYIQQSWLQLLINLWNRTGAAAGASIFNSGDLKESAVDGPQSGWLVCDGSAISRTLYPSLFAAIGTTYGAGDGTTTFNIPDYRGRFRIGADSSFPLGISGGSSTQTLTTSNLASHSHTITDPGHTHTVTDPTHTHGINDPGHVHSISNVNNTNTRSAGGLNTVDLTPGIIYTDTGYTGISAIAASTGITNQSSITGITVQNTGSATPFSIIPPYLPSTVLIKI